MPDKPSIGLKWESPVQSNLDLAFIDGSCIFRVDDLVKIFLVTPLAVLLTALDGEPAVVPFPVVLDYEVYHGFPDD